MCDNQKDSWIIRFLEWILPTGFDEGIIGDLLEEYEAGLNRKGYWKSKLTLFWGIIRFTHPFLLVKRVNSSPRFSLALLRHQGILSIRTLRKQKAISSINIFGLSLSTAFIILSFLYIKTERQFDKFHSDKDHIWRVYQSHFNLETGQKNRESAITSSPLGKDLGSEIPQIKRYSRVGSSSGNIIVEDVHYSEVYTFVDSDFLHMFDFPLLYGDKSKALSDPRSIVLSQKLANKYFNKTNAVGEIIKCQIGDQMFDALVTAIIDPKTDKSSIQFEMLMPFDNYESVVGNEMFNSHNFGIVENYIQTYDDIDPEVFSTLISASIQKFITNEKEMIKLGIQSLEEIHMSNGIVGNASFSNPRKVYISLALAIVVLIISNINFINLSLSQVLDRLDEMSLRKILGATSGGIRSQLIIESILVSTISIILGLTVVHFSLPYITRILQLPIDLQLDFYTWIFLASILIGTGLTAGLIQMRIIQSSYRGKGESIISRNTRGELFMKRGLIVIQFALSLILVVGTYALHQQMKFIQEKELGYDSEFLIELALGETENLEESQRLVNRFKNALRYETSISSIGATMNSHQEPWTKLTIEQNDGSNRSIYYNQVDEDYLATMNLQLIDGKGFQSDTSDNHRYIIVNESLLKYFGWNNFNGKHIPGKNLGLDHEIIGVVKDFHFESLHHQIEPLILALDDRSIKSGITGLSTYVWPPSLYQIILKIKDRSIGDVIESLRNEWKSVFPDRPFQYSIVDDTIEARYRDEQRWSSIVQIGSLFAITVAWLGLFSLLQFSMKKRLKEIGIRKVLGATPGNILILLSKQFLTLVCMGCLMALPVSMWLTTKWLDTFAYKAHISFLEFALLIMGVIGLTIILIYIESRFATKQNPAILLHEK